MSTNSIRIACNQHTGKISFFYKNEIGEWLLLSKSSPLSRHEYTENFKEKCEEILGKIDTVYNRKNKGVVLHFEGNDADYKVLKGVIEEKYQEKGISCKKESIGIAVLGKPASGKTELVKAVTNNQGGKYSGKKEGTYQKFEDKKNNITWYEFKGWESFDQKSKENLERTIGQLTDMGLQKIVYCISGAGARIENCEEDLIGIHELIPSIDVITVVTKCYTESAQCLVNEIEKIQHTETVFPTNLIEEKSKDGVIVKAFGIDEIATYLIEGKKSPRNLPKAINESASDSEKVIQIDEGTEKGKTEEQNTTPAIQQDEVEKDNSKKIAVLGRCASGKTTLIQGINNHLQHQLRESVADEYFKYSGCDGTIWYEIKGIDIGVGEPDRAFSSLENLVDKKINTIIYCISGNESRLDKSEMELIQRIADTFSSIKFLIVLTDCYQEKASELLNVLNRIVPSENIIQTLAEPFRIKKKNRKTGKPIEIASFGLDELTGAMKLK